MLITTWWRWIVRWCTCPWNDSDTLICVASGYHQAVHNHCPVTLLNWAANERRKGWWLVNLSLRDRLRNTSGCANKPSRHWLCTHNEDQHFWCVTHFKYSHQVTSICRQYGASGAHSVNLAGTNCRQKNPAQRQSPIQEAATRSKWKQNTGQRKYYMA